MHHDSTRGFTLIELLVVISIISLLSSVILASLNSARGKAHDAARRQGLVQMRNALELYRVENGRYPVHSGSYCMSGGVAEADALNGLSPGWADVACSNGNDYIKDTSASPVQITPKYISALPSDPTGTLSKWPSPWCVLGGYTV